MLRMEWTVTTGGWADCLLADQDAEAAVEASCVSEAPEELLTAVARVLSAESEARADFPGEPVGFRWILHRDGEYVAIRILQLPDRHAGDLNGTEVWTSRQPVDVLARTVIRCFDNVAATYGESEYHRRWRHPFPRFQLEALRTLWRAAPPASR
jgi:hypothetical protein